MLYAWKMSGVAFNAVHYTYGTNTAGTDSVIEFCEKQAIKLDIRTFDAKGFISSKKLVEMAKRYDCTSPQILTYIEFTKQHPKHA